MAIVLESLRKVYNGRAVVNGISLKVQKGEVVGLLGPNGAGKTTTFYMTVGLVKPNGGKVFLDGDDVARLPMHLRAKRGMGYLSQESSVFRKLTVSENILLIWEMMDVPREGQKARLPLLLGEFGLLKVKDQYAFTLSGGERRRVELARALATSPSYILLDEPFTGIDPIAIAEIQQIIARLKQKGLGVLITDHNVHETLSITDRSYLLFEGKILISGSSSHCK
ncbi:MAG: LPS export ABC transporter ATP-binding protein [Armatimonadetes bacterium]|nr:LPS export ABC transporter ATP-binding protein [Armatimonadota bacterium]